MNKKGFAISGMLYTILLIFVTLLIMLLYNLQNRKTILDELKIDVVEANEQQALIDSLASDLLVIQTDFTDKRTWKKQGGTITGTTVLTLPAIADYNELHIVVKYGSAVFVFDLIKLELTASAQLFYTGYEATTANYGRCIISATTTQVNTHSVYINGTNQVATATMDVYYR